MPYSNQVASTQTTNIVPVQAVFNSAGVCLGLIGPGGTYFSPPLTGDVINGATINNSSIGTTTPAAGSFTNISAAGNLLISTTLPTLGSGWGTGATITATSTAGFKITVGTGGASVGTINFPAAQNGWVVTAWDVTSGSTYFLQQTAVSTTSATVSAFGITTGTTATVPAGDTILVMAIAF